MFNDLQRCKFFVWADEMGSGGSTLGGGGARGGQCYKCGEQGHFASACPQGGSGMRGGGSTTSRALNGAYGMGSSTSRTAMGGSVSGTCFKCGEVSDSYKAGPISLPVAGT